MTVSINEVIEQIVAVLDEGFDATPEKSWTYFADHTPESRLMPALSALTAEQASREIGGNSIAAHAWHVAFGMKASTEWIRGQHQEWGWEESWKVKSVTDAEWQALLERLRGAHRELRQTIVERGAENVLALGGAIAAAAHLAYHLGAIRQKITYLGHVG